jgi:hypothetical protein
MLWSPTAAYISKIPEWATIRDEDFNTREARIYLTDDVNKNFMYGRGDFHRDTEGWTDTRSTSRVTAADIERYTKSSDKRYITFVLQPDIDDASFVERFGENVSTDSNGPFAYDTDEMWLVHIIDRKKTGFWEPTDMDAGRGARQAESRSAYASARASSASAAAAKAAASMSAFTGIDLYKRFGIGAPAAQRVSPARSVAELLSPRAAAPVAAPAAAPVAARAAAPVAAPAAAPVAARAAARAATPVVAAPAAAPVTRGGFLDINAFVARSRSIPAETRSSPSASEILRISPRAAPAAAPRAAPPAARAAPPAARAAPAAGGRPCRDTSRAKNRYTYDELLSIARSRGVRIDQLAFNDACRTLGLA